jgi:uncharacterized protein (TIGR02284 family)
MTVKETKGEILDALNKLLTRSLDAEKGYHEAAEHVKGVELRQLLLAQAQQRSEFAMELDREVRALGGQPTDGTSLLADLHRAWIDIKAALAGNEDKATVEECKRGDKEALDDYTAVLQETDLMASTRSLLLTQQEKIETAHASMSRLALVV